VARAAGAADGLRAAGVGGYEGVLAADRSAAGLAAIQGYLRELRDVAGRLDGAGLFCGTDEIVVTAGGSAYPGEVVAALGPAAGWALSRPVRTVLRSGAYITHDDGHYRDLTP